MRMEIAELHKSLKTTMIYVTHDQVEAMTMADKIVVLQAGVIEQVGSPMELYRTPANQFVAGFIGSPKMNFIGGKTAADLGGATIGIRPEHVNLSADSGDWAGTVGVTERLGADTFLRIDAGDQGILNVRADGEITTGYGDKVFLTPDPSKIHRFDQNGISL